VKFVFATTDVQKVLPTIISRCQRFDLKPITVDLIMERLGRIAAAEKINRSQAALGEHWRAWLTGACATPSRSSTR